VVKRSNNFAKYGKYHMTKKLEEIFGFDKLNNENPVISEQMTVEETRSAIIEIDDTIDKIDEALPAIRDLEASDKELDELANLAKQSYTDLSDLGMNVDSRYAAELFAVAGNMLGHALTAKTTKLNKKLKMIDLQLKKLKLDQDAAKRSGDLNSLPTAEGQLLTRNDLLERLLSDRAQKDN
jgi:hypothetical protein